MKYYIILWRKIYDFLKWKFINFEQKWVLGLGFSEKHHSRVNKYWRAMKHVSHFSIIFKFYMHVLIVSKSSEILWISKTISALEKEEVKIFIYYAILMKFFIQNICLNVNCKLRMNVKKSAYGGPSLSPSPYNLKIFIYYPISILAEN